ncbi:MAG: EVE domain-containing protein [Saprospiraceae bacterium]|nr:EVE domain-containing protein [Saprospiraceae bacterium]
MNYWLIKSEPFEYSYDQLIEDKKTMWDGIRSYASRLHLRNMKKGDLAFFYHSRKGLEIIGIAKIVKEYYPDPTATEGDWSVVDVKPLKRMKQPVSLKEIKANPKLAEMKLVKISRLSVMPITPAEWKEVLKMGKTSV